MLARLQRCALGRPARRVHGLAARMLRGVDAFQGSACIGTSCFSPQNLTQRAGHVAYGADSWQMPQPPFASLQTIASCPARTVRPTCAPK